MTPDDSVARPSSLTPVDFDPFAEAERPLSFPLTDAQKEMWIAVQMGEDASRAYNQCFPIRLRGPLSTSGLRRALERLVDRHEALRLTFDGQGETQIIGSAPSFSWQSDDLANLSPENRDQAIADIVDQELHDPFDLTTGPLLRARLVTLDSRHHLLVLTAHHIVCDGWSAGVLFQDLAALYASEEGGGDRGLPVPGRFSDYARWQAALQDTPTMRAAEAYWLGVFQDSSPLLELPTDRPRSAEKTYHGAQQAIHLGAEFTKQLRRMSAKHGCTMYMTLLAAYEVLLYRLSGQSDLVVGIPVAGQAAMASGSVVGHCVNTLPLRTTVQDDAPFTRQLQRTKQEVVDAQEHQALTFGSLLQKLRLARDASRTPLVSTTFNLDRIGALPPFGRVTVELVTPPKRFVNFEIALNVVDTGQDLRVECDYNTALFDAETIQRWLSHYQTLLAGIAANPEEPVWALPLLTAAERRQLVVEWNATASDYPRDACIHDLFEAQARTTPNRPALVYEGTTLTYEVLNRRANRLAHDLRMRGVGPDVLVGLCMERSIEMVVGLLGILKAGGAYVPLDAGYPPDRLAFMLEDARVPVLLTQERLASRLPEHRAEVVYLDGSAELVSPEGAANPVSGVAADNLAYVIYTSGSTGTPKGVQISHRALVNLLCSMRREPGLTERDVLLSVTTLSFDIAGLELYLPLITGARVDLVSREEAADGGRLARRLATSGATIMQATPATWRLLIEAGWRGSPRLRILCGGEAMSRKLATQLLERGAEVWNLYGPTETTIWSMVHRVDPGAGPVPIGRPIANTQVYILDGRGLPVPVGVPGELHVGGAGLARGYRDQPELTAEKFIPDPFRDTPAARLYKTGDVARYRPDGRVEFLGRRDHQVKVRGFRIELGEIAAVLSQHPTVRHAVAMVREDSPDDKRLVAYVVVVGEGASDVSELRSFLRMKLPEYMVPTAIVQVETIPLTPNGKVDRRVLPPPTRENRDSDGAGTGAMPVTPVERSLAEMWRGLLGLERVEVRDTFFDLGGHSLLAMRFIERVEAHHGVRLSIRDVMLHNLGQLAAVCEERSVKASSDDSPETGLGRRLSRRFRGLTGPRSDPK